MDSAYIYGFHAVSKMIQHSAPACAELLYLERKNNQRLQQVIALAKQYQVPQRSVARDELDSLTGVDKHQGCVLRIVEQTTAPQSLEQLIQGMDKNALFLVLDGVQDPHNLGACLRTADATGVSAVIIPKDRSAKLTATVRKVAAGGAETVPLLEVTNISRCLQELKKAGVWIYGTSGEANASLYDFDYATPVALVMGAEGAGLRRLTMEQCDELIKLPMLGVVESLNISVATGVCLYQILRSRMACS